MSTLGELAIKLGLDSVEFQQGLTKAEHKARKFADRTIQYLDNIESAAKNINKATQFEFRIQNLDRLRNIANATFKITDEYTQLANKLQLVTDSEAQHARAMADVYDISLKTAQSSQATSSVYQTFAQNAKELGLAQSDVARLTEIVSKSVAISGASSATASNALVQFSQSLLMGKMKAQEFNSLMTQTPSVVQAIAKGLGVTTAELKAMVDKGELSAQKMVEGLKKAESSVNDLYGKTSTTVSGAMQNITTATEKWIGEINKTTGATEKVIGILDFTAKHLDEIGGALSVAAGGWAIYHGKNKVQEIIKSQAAIYDEKQAIIEATLESIAIQQQKIVAEKQLIATKQALKVAYAENAVMRSQAIAGMAAATTSTTIFSRATAAAKNEIRLMTAAALANPIMTLTFVLGIAGTAFWTFTESQKAAREEALRYADSLDQVSSKIKEMTKAQIQAEQVRNNRFIREQEAKLEKLIKKHKQLQQVVKETEIIEYDSFAGLVVGRRKKSIEELTKANEDLALSAEKVEEAQARLNKAYENQKAIQAQMPVAELQDRFSALFPEIEKSKIQIDGLNIAIDGFKLDLPSTVVETLKFSDSLDEVAKSAIDAAVKLYRLNKEKNAALAPTISADAQKIIDRNSTQAEIARLEKAGNFKQAAKLKAKLQVDGDKFKGADYDALVKSFEESFLSQYQKGGAGKSNRRDWQTYYNELQRRKRATPQSESVW